MPELEIKTFDDLHKLNGWTIQEAAPVQGDAIGMRLKLTHPAAAKAVYVILTAHQAVQMNGNITMHTIHFNLSTLDVPESEPTP